VEVTGGNDERRETSTGGTWKALLRLCYVRELGSPLALNGSYKEEENLFLSCL
jgi:hypothetical protein